MRNDMTGELQSAKKGSMDKLFGNQSFIDCPREVKSSCQLKCDCQNSTSRKLTVLGKAAYDFPPSYGVMTIFVSSSKEKADEAIESVDRRVKYIQQVVKKNSVKDSEISILESMTKQTTVQSEEFIKKSEMKICSLLKNLSIICNILLQKLASSIRFSDIEPIFTHTQLNTYRSDVTMQALQNAKLKATNICGVMGMEIISVLFFEEKYLTETKKENIFDHNHLSLSERISERSIFFESMVSVIYEIKSNRS